MILMTETELQQRFGVTATILHDLEIKGLPHIMRGDHRVYDLQELERWLRDNRIPINDLIAEEDLRRCKLRNGLPLGEHITQAQRVDARSKKKAKPRIRFLLRVIEGPHLGRNMWKVSMLSTEAARSQFIKELTRIGLPLPVLDSPARLLANFRKYEHELRSMKIRVRVELRGDNKVIYFKEKAGEISPDGAR